VEQKCKAHDDCSSKGCNFESRCADRPSCGAVNPGEGAKGFWGRVTCGTQEYDYPEPTDLNAQESCCTSLHVPSINMGMDKFIVTAGRMRTFLERVNYDVKSFVKSLPPDAPNWNHNWDEKVPGNLSEAFDALGPGDSGPTPVHPRAGCALAFQGMRTYYWSGKAVCGGDKSCEAGPEFAYGFPQYVYDLKELNCVEGYLGAAFCAWDGGRLASFDEIHKAATAGGHTYPWGNQDPTTGDHLSAFGKQYYWPYVADPNDMLTPDPAAGDTNIHAVGIPGRYPNGQSVDMIQGLVGDMLMQSLASSNPIDGFKDIYTGSWEGHPASYAVVNFSENQAYWASGIRCVRPDE
jgi:hypothetical protein